jgi:hypothetical protein
MQIHWHAQCPMFSMIRSLHFGQLSLFRSCMHANFWCFHCYLWKKGVLFLDVIILEKVSCMLCLEPRLLFQYGAYFKEGHCYFWKHVLFLCIRLYLDACRFMHVQ